MKGMDQKQFHGGHLDLKTKNLVKSLEFSVISATHLMIRGKLLDRLHIIMEVYLIKINQNLIV